MGSWYSLICFSKSYAKQKVKQYKQKTSQHGYKLKPDQTEKYFKDFCMNERVKSRKIVM